MTKGVVKRYAFLTGGGEMGELTRNLAQNHQGDIYATANPGSGATFHILLPANPTDRADGAK
jgi:signal transduction histidine kinase